MSSTEVLFFILGILVGASISMTVSACLDERKERLKKRAHTVDTLVNASSLARQGAKVGAQINCFHFSFLKTDQDRYRFLGKTSELKNKERP